ncbi:MAG: response regulator transcription factor [Verrucomicrobia bacterium]|jgi:DNA-binding NarL/FixJ family response regulator|nr:response regulator transcription factor [Verrucomicrobiota bacterium]
MKKIRVMLVDDHEVVRIGVRSLLNKENDLTVVAEATSCSDAVAQAKAKTPDVIIMDIGLKDSSGIDATRQIMDDSPTTRIVALSMHSSPVYIRNILQAGACGYLVKDGIAGELINAVRTVLDHRVYVSPEFLNAAVNPGRKYPASEPAGELSKLSPREHQVFVCTVNDMSLKDIGIDLGISEKTVETHRMRVREKLGITGNGALIRLAIREGIIPTVD